MFHLAELIVVLRRYELKGLIFGAMPQKIPGVRGQSPWGVLERLRKLSDFRIGSIAYLLDGRSSPALLPRKAGGEGGQKDHLFGCLPLKGKTRNDLLAPPSAVRVRLPANHTSSIG